MQILSGTVNLTGGGTVSGMITAASDTNLGLNGQNLTSSSVITSAGSVGLSSSTEAGSYSAAGGTAAYDSSFTGTVIDLGPSLSVSGTVSFAPAMGGPVTLTTGTLSVGGELTGTDSFVADGLLTLDRFSTLSFTGSMDAYGGIAMINPVTFNGTVLNNYGAATWDASTGGGWSLVLEAGAMINNQPGATFAMVSTGAFAVIVAGDDSAVAFNNAGTVTCDTASSFGINLPFINSGTVDVQQGSLGLGGDGSTVSSGTFTGDAGTSLNIGGQVLTASSTISSDGSVGINSSTEAGSYSAAGGTAAYDSSFTGTVIDLGPSLSVSGTVELYPPWAARSL